jgi:hypothetical protein
MQSCRACRPAPGPFVSFLRRAFRTGGRVGVGEDDGPLIDATAARVLRRCNVFRLLRATGIGHGGRPISLSTADRETTAQLIFLIATSLQRATRVQGPPLNVEVFSNVYHPVFIRRFLDGEELEDRRGITRSKACRMPTNGSRQGMRAGPEMVGRGHVASLRGCDPSCYATSSRAGRHVRGSTDRRNRPQEFSLCAALVAIRMRYQGEHGGEPWRFRNFRDWVSTRLPN